MPYTEHDVVKAEALAATAAQVLEQNLTIPAIFDRENFDQYQGSLGDVVNVRVEGVLPFHNYGFRNDRTNEIIVDTYSERKITVGLADHFYQAVELTDEQKEWDLLQWGNVLNVQAKAVARGLQRGAIAHVEAAPYAVTVGRAEAQLTQAITEARRVLNRFQVPGERWLIVGSDFENAMQLDDRINLAQNAGDAQADNALHDAVLGRIKGFTVVLDQTIDPSAAYAMVGGAFVWANATPVPPQSLAFAATSSFEGVGMRVLRQYESKRFKDLQVVDTWSGFRTVSDPLVYWDPTIGAGSEVVTAGEHFVRGVKLSLEDDSAYPAAASELSTVTGVNDTNAYAASTTGV